MVRVVLLALFGLLVFGLAWPLFIGFLQVNEALSPAFLAQRRWLSIILSGIVSAGVVLKMRRLMY